MISIYALKSPIYDVITNDPAILTKCPEDQLRKLVIEPIQSLPQTTLSVIAIVIDALDECQNIGQMAKFVTLLANAGLFFIYGFLSGAALNLTS